ncbi:MAG: nucleotidyltransferase domain-containing protein [Deltaproteobacteria bacterium]|nr:nucleotidyltransferase domain-containing protein [Deltaproteobacteria bacterium]
MRLRNRLPLLRKTLPLKRVILFGSYAAGRQTVASDVDLLVVYAGETQENAYALVKRTLGIPRVEPHVYSEGEYELVKETLDRMIQNGITVDEAAVASS